MISSNGKILCDPVIYIYKHTYEHIYKFGFLQSTLGQHAHIYQFNLIAKDFIKLTTTK